MRTDVAYLRRLEHRSAMHEFTEADNGQNVAVHPGEHLLVRLPERPGAGFAWKPVCTPDFLELVGAVYDAEGGNAGSEMLGEGEAFVLVYQVRSGADTAPEQRLLVAEERPYDQGAELDFELAVRLCPDGDRRPPSPGHVRTWRGDEGHFSSAAPVFSGRGRAA